jgi:hypothetical protein
MLEEKDGKIMLESYSETYGEMDPNSSWDVKIQVRSIIYNI